MKLLLIMLCIVLYGCSDGPVFLNTEQRIETDEFTVTFERDAYSFDEMDEVFYRIDNHSDETFILGDTLYFIEKLEEDEWVLVDNHHYMTADSEVVILPGESAEFILWLSVNSLDYTKGNYRAHIRILLADQTEEKRELYETHPPIIEDVYLPFDIQ